MRVLKSIQSYLILLLSLLFFSCASTRNIKIYDDYQNSTEFSSPKNQDEDEAFIFFRLYNPSYNNPLDVTNLLKFGIYSTNISEYLVSHASINFDLTDNFYGLSLGGDHHLKIEQCTNISKNPYFKKCNAETSEQYVYALKVPRSEYEATRQMVLDFYNNKNLKYSVLWNFPFAKSSVKRKFFTRKKNRNFGKKKLSKRSYNISEDINPEHIPTVYVCSTFISFVLLQNVSSISDFFTEHKIDYRYVGPGDIESFPGIIKLFYSNWDDYNLAAKNFVLENPDFASYLF